MSADEFTLEGPVTANALQAATAALLAAEAWIDGAAPVYSTTDGKLHPLVVQPLAGAIVSVTGVAPIEVARPELQDTLGAVVKVGPIS